MALKATWVDRVDGVDDASAEAINEVAHAVIDLEEKQPKEIVIDSEMSDTSTNPAQNKIIKAYVDEIANKSNYETILEGELTEGGVSEITTLIPVDLTQYKQLQFYAKVNVAEVESGTSCLHALSICDKNHAAYNSGLIYLPVTNNGKTSYVWDCESNIYKTENEHVFLTKFSIIAGFGNSFATNPRALAANIKTSNITNQSYPPHLSMRITNTTFEAGTKYYLRGIR